MRKNLIAILIAVCLILALCAACGGSAGTEEAVEVSESYEVTPSPEPAGEPAEDTPEESAAEPEAEEGSSLEDDEAYLAALDLIGASKDDLIAAIGEPFASSYVESCLVVGGEDGFLYYDNFTVETIRRSDGSEFIYDVY